MLFLQLCIGLDADIGIVGCELVLFWVCDKVKKFYALGREGCDLFLVNFLGVSRERLMLNA